MANLTDPKNTTLRKLLAERRLDIPSYQRSYSWGRKQIDEFLQDLKENSEVPGKVWFLGILYTYKLDGDVSALLDGQQRLTTMFIFLKELMLYRDIVFDQELKSEFNDYSNQQIFPSLFKGTVAEPKLKLDQGNSEESEGYLVAKTQDDANIGIHSDSPQFKSHKRLQEAIEYIRKWIENELQDKSAQTDDFERFKTLVGYILDEIEIIEIELKGQGAFNEIFENINDRGLHLTESDKFKNLCCLFAPDLPRFEREWFENANKIYKLGKDLDDDVFDFYYRSLGIDDNEDKIRFLGRVRGDLRDISGPTSGLILEKRRLHVFEVFDRIRDMVNFLATLHDYKLIELYHGHRSAGPNLKMSTDVVQTLLIAVWNAYPQFGVLAFAALFKFKNRSNDEEYLLFLRNLMSAIRFYMSAVLERRTSNVIRPLTIQIARKLNGQEAGPQDPFAGELEDETEAMEGEVLDVAQIFDSIAEAIDSNPDQLDFPSKLRRRPVDRLSDRSPGLTRILILLAQANRNPALISQYNKAHSWSIEHLAPRSWQEYCRYLADDGTVDEGLLNEPLDFPTDLDKPRCRLQEFIGNKFILSSPLNSAIRNRELGVKQTAIRDAQQTPMILPSIDGLDGLLDLTSLDARVILARTAILADIIINELQSKKLPVLE